MATATKLNISKREQKAYQVILNDNPTTCVYSDFQMAILEKIHGINYIPKENAEQRLQLKAYLMLIRIGHNIVLNQPFNPNSDYVVEFTGDFKMSHGWTISHDPHSSRPYFERFKF